jgi:hypothetical protein
MGKNYMETATQCGSHAEQQKSTFTSKISPQKAYSLQCVIDTLQLFQMLPLSLLLLLPTSPQSLSKDLNNSQKASTTNRYQQCRNFLSYVNETATHRIAQAL